MMKNYSERIKDADIKTAMKEALNPGSTGGNEWRLPDGDMLSLIKAVGNNAIEGACNMGEAPDVLDTVADLSYKLGQVVDGYYDIEDYNELKSVCIEHPYDEDKKAIPYTIIFYTDPTDDEDEYDYHPFWATDLLDTSYGKEWADGDFYDVTERLQNILTDLNGHIAELSQAKE